MKQRKLGLPLIAAFTMIAFLTACKKDTYVAIESLCPEVVSVNPANLATGVPINQVVSVTFNEKMNPATINAASFILKGSANVAGTISYDNANATAYFEPDAPLSPNTIYTGRVTTAMKDPMGNALQEDFVWTFNTGTTLAPVVISTDPANNATGVILKQVVKATFNVAMDNTTFNSNTFILKDGNNSVSGAVTYSGNTAYFTPASDLTAGTIYTARITTGVRNNSGTSLSRDYIWIFSTRSPTMAAGLDLKSVGNFGIIAATGISNNAGLSQIRDLDVGISPGVRSSITGFPPALVINGSIYASDDASPAGVAAMLTQAKLDLTNVYLQAEGASSPAPAAVSGDLGGRTLAPGIYKSTSSLLIQSGDLTLDAEGNVNAVWIFQIASAFTTVGGAGGSIILTGGAQAKNIYWQTGSSATLGDGTAFYGNILAFTSITMNSNATAVGRMLVRNGAVVMTNSNVINKP